MSSLQRPGSEDQHEYYTRYTDLVPDGDIIQTLRNQIQATLELLRSVPAEKETFRYAEGKWSLREVIGHLLDTERVFSFRALTMARQDAARLPGMDQEDWCGRNNAHERTLQDLADEWAALRELRCGNREAHGCCERVCLRGPELPMDHRGPRALASAADRAGLPVRLVTQSKVSRWTGGGD